MKLYAPKYYKQFNCIADKCKHSCCIGWEIDIDSETLGKYNSLSAEASESILNSIDFCNSPHFKLLDNKRCQNLDENGLCTIIKSMGEDYLCDICREHPRFYNFTNRGKEVGIGMSCEEACRIILSSDDYDEMIEIAEVPGDEDISDFDAITRINIIYKNLLNSRYNHRIIIYYAILSKRVQHTLEKIIHISTLLIKVHIHLTNYICKFV